MTALRVVEASAIHGRGTAIVVEFEDGGTVRAGDLARVRLVSGTDVAVRSVELADYRDVSGTRVGSSR